MCLPLRGWLHLALGLAALADAADVADKSDEEEDEELLAIMDDPEVADGMALIEEALPGTRKSSNCEMSRTSGVMGSPASGSGSAGANRKHTIMQMPLWSRVEWGFGVLSMVMPSQTISCRLSPAEFAAREAMLSRNSKRHPLGLGPWERMMKCLV